MQLLGTKGGVEIKINFIQRKRVQKMLISFV